MEFIPRPGCPAVLLAQAFCSSTNGKACATDAKKTERETARCDGQSDTKLKREKHNTFSFAFCNPPLQTTHTTESITRFLQRYLIFTIPAKKFHEMWIHHMLNCTTEADTSVFLLFLRNKWLGKSVSVTAARGYLDPVHWVLSCDQVHEQKWYETKDKTVREQS